jgi:hypothetical protein
MKTPSILDYTNYRQYLADMISHRKEMHKSGSSLRAWARRLGFAAHSHLILILKGERRLPMERVASIAERFHLSEYETEYLETLVLDELLGPHESTQRRNRARLVRLRNQARQHPLQKFAPDAALNSEYYEIYEMLACAFRALTVEDISSLFIKPPPRADIETVLGTFMKWGLTKVDGQGAYILDEPKQTAEIAGTRRREHAWDSEAGVRPQEILTTPLTIPLSQLEKLKKLSKKWQAEALSLGEGFLGEKRQVVILTVSILPVSKVMGPESHE